ncbi:MAG TPA: folylpolyglutamate synthase/dihydrofolate synthase family protein [Actinomycetota bacterium]|nr:folylpolyglutamate synthase/dihydrofolate synthase family protein [Actinomycetota bacterium]
MALSYTHAKHMLESRGFGITPGLARIEALTRLLGEPQLRFPTIHLAGTNGKTSTARLITAILAAHGLTTGLYTSPHLNDVEERFVLAGWDDGLISEQMTPDELAETVSYLKPFVELVENEQGEPVTYFELTTAMAFEWMSERSVAAGVIETGLGGRWDATNLVDSAVSVLTQVGVDHTAYLGDTPAANASEKVDIVKPGSTVVSASQAPEVLQLLEARAGKVGATVVLLGRDFFLDSNETAVGGRSVSMRTARGSYTELFVPLHGAHQGVNLALAVAATEAFLDRELDFDLLQSALSAATSPGRLEVMGRQPLVVLDGAHNPHAAVALKTTLASDFLFKNLTMVLSIFEDKDLRGMLELLVPSADRVIFTRADNPRAAKPEVLRDAAPVVPGQDPPDLVEPLERAVDRALEISDDDDMVLVTGSLHAVGEARRHLLSRSSG